MVSSSVSSCTEADWLAWVRRNPVLAACCHILLLWQTSWSYREIVVEQLIVPSPLPNAV